MDELVRRLRGVAGLFGLYCSCGGESESVCAARHSRQCLPCRAEDRMVSVWHSSHGLLCGPAGVFSGVQAMVVMSRAIDLRTYYVLR